MTTNDLSFSFRLARLFAILFIVMVAGKFVITLALFPRYLAQNPLLSLVEGWAPEEFVATLAELGLPPTASSWLSMSLVTLSSIIFCVVGLVILVRKTNDWFGLYVAVVFVLFPTTANYSNNVIIHFYPALEVPIKIAGNMAWPLFFILFYLFPDGRFVPHWTRWIVPFFLGITLVGTLFPEWGRTGWFSVPAVIFIFSGVGGQIYRYGWYANVTQRQQTKWVLYAILGIILLLLISLLLTAFPLLFRNATTRLLVEIVRNILTFFALTLFPISIGLAILRYRLWDIDVIIRKTVQYTLITGLLGLVYFGTVVLLQNLFFGNQTSEIAIVLSTLLIAGLFNPLRRGIQDFIDRRFYRKKYDAAQVLANFTKTCQDETDMEALTAELLHIIQETLQPVQVTIWLKPTGNHQRTEN